MKNLNNNIEIHFLTLTPTADMNTIGAGGFIPRVSEMLVGFPINSGIELITMIYYPQIFGLTIREATRFNFSL